ncbi:LPXTG cell wall anchor domain-containing protein [Bacillus clarus]|uniref:LPXTG cell wall anchor domain protein n=1 Tax=Bacillus clarus TaxID=2338372 RepID=A0A090YLJ3_9BACI|nr:LPXTG cell wall anchor domain-containing protein [Bacillus clarus]KFM99683.1 LPXTG cell wall anchor domain protein [Bacillus clarus]RFT65975.1 LPXTG cell wall anchor domain-containing protein [Bacillus clarus]
MLKKVSAVTLVSLLALSPVAALAAPEGNNVKQVNVEKVDKETVTQSDNKDAKLNEAEQKKDQNQGNKEVSKEIEKTIKPEEKKEAQEAKPNAEKKLEPVKENKQDQKKENVEQKNTTPVAPLEQATNKPLTPPPVNKEEKIDVSNFSGNVVGKAKWDPKKNHYVLDITATVTSKVTHKANNLYLGVTIPKGLDGDFKEDEGMILEDGSKIIKIQLPDMEPNKAITKNIKIPVIGNVASEKISKDIELYLIDKDEYDPLGKMKGSANIDFSEMNKDIRFEGKVKATTCVPNLKENEFTLDFLLTTQNLTIEDLKGFDVEIDVPKDIKLTIPDHYKQAEIPDYLKDASLQEGLHEGAMNLDIKWNGNTATIPVKAMEAGEGSALYFQIVGETAKDLKDLKVTFTAKRGDQTVKQQVAIEKVENKDCKKQDDKNTVGNNNGDGKGTGNNTPNTKGPDSNQVIDKPNQITPTKVTTTPVKVNDKVSLPKTGASQNDNLLTLMGVVMLAGGALVYKRSRMNVNK